MTNEQLAAMKQALEILHYLEALNSDTQRQKMEAISALRTAIEQAEKQEPVGEVLNERGEVDYISYVPPAGTLLYTPPPAAPVQEPDKHLQLALEALAPLEKLLVQADEQGLLNGANVDCQIATIELRKSAYAASDIRAYLNTTPPAAQRQWVGLDYQEMVELAGGRLTRDERMIACAVEAKLREKNGGN